MTLNNNVIKLGCAKFWIDNEILFCEINNPDETQNLNEVTVDSYLNAISTLCEGKKMPFLIDLRNTRGAFLNTAAKKLAESSELAKLSLSEAFVENSLKVELLINSYKRIYEPVIPYEIFKDYDAALNFSINAKNRNNGSK